MKKKFKQVFVDLSDEEYENNLQAKSDSFSVSNNLNYLYDAPSLNQNNDYKFYDNASFGNSNKNRNNIFNQAKQVSNFSNERKNSEEIEADNYNQNLSLKEKESNTKSNRAHPIFKIINTILSKKYNLGPIEKETLLEKTSVFSYNSAFKPITNKSTEDINPDLILNNSYEKLSSMKKKNFLLNPSNLKNGTNKSNYNLFRLDNSIIKPKANRLWENAETQESYGAKRLLSKKRSRYENDDYARYSPEYEKKHRWENKNFDFFDNSIRNSRKNKFTKDYEMEEKRKAYYDFRALNDSKLSFSNVHLSELKLNQLHQSKENAKSKNQENINNKTSNNSFAINEEKNSIFSNQNLQDKNNVFFNKPFNKSKPEMNFNNEINLSTIDNLNSSISSRQNNLDYYGNKGLKDKSLEEIRAELNEKKKANQKLLNEIHSKTKRSFRGENFGIDEFSHSNSNSKKLIGNKSNIRNLNDDDEIVNYKNKNYENEDDFNYLDEKRRKIADFYRNKDLMNKNDLDLISGSNADYYMRKNRFGVFDENKNKYDEDNYDAGKTFSFKNINKYNRDKKSDQDEEFLYNNNKSISKNKEANLVESDKDSASFGGDNSIKEKSHKSLISSKSNKKIQEKPKEENKNTNNLFAIKQKEEEEPLFSNSNYDNINKSKVFNVFGNNTNNEIDKKKDLTNIFGNKVNNETEKEKDKHENINEITKPSSLFDNKFTNDQAKEKTNISVSATATGENKEKEQEISLPSNNNLFGANQENKPNSLFNFGSNQEKNNIDENYNAFPILNQMAKKSENTAESSKATETKPLLGGFVYASNSLFGAASVPKPNNTPLVAEKKAEENIKVEIKADTSILNNNNFNHNNSLFSFGNSNQVANTTNTLFGFKTENGNKSLFSFADENKEENSEKMQEAASPKFAANILEENKALTRASNQDKIEEPAPAKIYEKKEDEIDNEFPLLKNLEQKDINEINEMNKAKEKEKPSSENSSAPAGFKPSIPGTKLFSSFTSTPSLLANANKSSLFGKPEESIKTETPKEKTDKETANDITNAKEENEKKEAADKPKGNEIQSSSLFGNKSNTTSSLFGNVDQNKPAATSSLFGNNTNTQSLFSKPAAESYMTSNHNASIFSSKPAEQSTSASASANNTFFIFTPKPAENAKLTNTSLFSNPNPSATGLFGASAPKELKPNEPQKDQNNNQASLSLFGTAQPKQQELTTENNSNKTTSLFCGADNLNAKADINNNNNNSTFSLFAKSNDENASVKEKTQPGLFSGLNHSTQNSNNNVFFAKPAQNKPTGSIFSVGLNSFVNNNDKFGINGNNSINSNKESNKIDTNKGSVGNLIGDKQQSKSLLNDNNPFLQKSNTLQNNLFTSNNSNQNAFSAQNNNANSNMNQQQNAFFVSSDKRNNGNRFEINQGPINNFGSNLFSNDNKTNPNPVPFSMVNNALFGQPNTNNSLLTNSNFLFGSNNTNAASSLFGNNAASNNTFGNNNLINNFNGGNDYMTISPVRSPNIQPKMNNTNVNNLFGGSTQPLQSNSVFATSGNNIFNIPNTVNQNQAGSSLFLNTNQNQGGLFNNLPNNNQTGTGLFDNIPNFLDNSNSKKPQFGGSGFTFGKK